MVQLRNTFNTPLFEKRFFYIFSLYLMIRGVGTLAWAFSKIADVSDKDWLGVNISLALFVIGIILIFFAFFAGGFSILYFDNAKFKSRCTCCISCTTVMLALLFLAMLIVQLSAGSYVLAQISRMTFVGSFERAFRYYNNRTEAMELVNHIQETANCCGIESYRDYRNILNISIPDSCCYELEEPWEPCFAEKAATAGCVPKLDLVRNYAVHAQPISVFVVIVVVVELIGFIFALHLVDSRRKRNAKMGSQ